MKADVARQVEAAFKAMGDLVVTATYRRCTGKTTVDGSSTLTFSDSTIKCIVTSFRRHEIAFAAGLGDIQSTDRKILVPCSALSAVPQNTDQIVVGGVTLSVIGATTDPAGAMYTIHARE